MTKEKTRAAFEAEWIRRMGNSFLQKDEGGEYTSDCTYDNHIWFTRGYQASAAESDVLIEELVEKLKDIAFAKSWTVRNKPMDLVGIALEALQRVEAYQTNESEG